MVSTQLRRGPVAFMQAPAPASGAAARPLAPADARRSPSVGLPLGFVLTGVSSLAGVFACVAVRPDLLSEYHYNQYIVAVTHLMVLGFVSSIVMGALYQLVPVALEVPLHSERLARWHLACHCLGVAGMVWMFWRWDLKQVGHFGSVFALGVGLFVYNLGRTLRRIPRWNVIAFGLASALWWLSVTVGVGLAVAAAKCTYETGQGTGARALLSPLLELLQQTARLVGRFDPLGVMHAHAHLGVVGFFLITLMAVSYKLVPMFALSALQKPARAAAALWFTNVGLAGLFVAVVVRSQWKPVFAGGIALGIALYLWELRAVFRARLRRTLDWGLRHFAAALVALGLTTALGLVLSWPDLPATRLTTQLENVYGWLALSGVFAGSILGFLSKIVPFLVWYHRYSPLVGRQPVPTLADLYSTRLQAAGFGLHFGGTAALAVAAAWGSAAGVRGAAILLVAGLASFGVNLGLMLRHLLPRKPALGSKHP